MIDAPRNEAEAGDDDIGSITFTPITPRVGGGSGKHSWTGGSNCRGKQSRRPASTLALRPIDFKSAYLIETAAMKGLPEGRRIGPDEKDSPITLTAWVSALKAYIEQRGMDTVFRIYDADANTEIYLLDEWGRATPTLVKEWVKALIIGLPNSRGKLDAS